MMPATNAADSRDDKRSFGSGLANVQGDMSEQVTQLVGSIDERPGVIAGTMSGHQPPEVSNQLRGNTRLCDGGSTLSIAQILIKDRCTGALEMHPVDSPGLVGVRFILVGDALGQQ